MRTAIHDALAKDLGSERLQAALLDAKDKAPAAPSTAKPAKGGAKPTQKPAAPTADQLTKRRTERTERFKPVAARLSAEVGRLSDTLTTYALAEHLGATNATAIKTPDAIQAAPKAVVARLDKEAIAKHVKSWAASAMDPYSAASVREALADGVPPRREGRVAGRRGESAGGG